MEAGGRVGGGAYLVLKEGVCPAVVSSLHASRVGAMESSAVKLCWAKLMC